MSRRSAESLFDQPSSGTPLWIAVVQLALKTRTVIAPRTAGMMGIVVYDPGEPFLILAEKQADLAELLYAVAQAAGEGANTDRVIAAGLRPFGKPIRANSCRLIFRRGRFVLLRVNNPGKVGVALPLLYPQ